MTYQGISPKTAYGDGYADGCRDTAQNGAAIRRAAQAVVDDAYEERVTGRPPMTIRRCRLCNLDSSTHSVLHECPIETLERLLRGAP